MLSFVAVLAFATQQASPCAPPAGAAPAASAAPAAVLPHDTPVELMALREVSTATAKPGMIFKLRVNRPIEVPDGPVIPIGTFAYGEVTAARDAASLGKSGRMQARLLCIQYGAVAIPLEGELSAKGQGAGSAGVAVLMGGVMGLFHRGNNAKIKAGEIVSGFVAADVPIDMSAAEQPAPAAQ